MTAPLMIQLAGKRCVVIGGGRIAARKIRFLLEEGADVTVISRECSKDLQPLRQQCHFLQKDLTKDHVHTIKSLLPDACFLAVVATNNRELNDHLSDTLTQHIPLINVVDNQEQSNFFFPAYIKQGLLKIAISTSGASPILAKKIKRHLQQEFGPEYKNYVKNLQDERTWAQKTFRTEEERKAYLEKITPFPLASEHEEN
ncbi:precorrin-2 dehydrogenase/sirohydrochlorin ferrochelatase family protein [Texcoconibacillus texcoconensis]|uniref:precorrin-2 dehydrogenase n=1 Tax=Texcoconibacillus texcoconensis TaxID=1095777 RepID=A0A840QRE5_9BACI|nr:bifunctional precorrin-2 dehydrogenase/sirohydrochlorin ferrochelatase [Texcoconibacillus texcoconensis]MBB5174036.1 precorrin-2 dehydrogenase/sirohydrochlorin ferrochelatase [Texcoconibacillus texcoconensis]